MMSECARHWFSVYGWPGTRSPTCVRCGAPNPRPLTKEERDQHEYVIQQKKERGY